MCIRDSLNIHLVYHVVGPYIVPNDQSQQHGIETSFLGEAHIPLPLVIGCAAAGGKSLTETTVKATAASGNNAAQTYEPSRIAPYPNARRPTFDSVRPTLDPSSIFCPSHITNPSIYCTRYISTLHHMTLVQSNLSPKKGLKFCRQGVDVANLV